MELNFSSLLALDLPLILFKVLCYLPKLSLFYFLEHVEYSYFKYVFDRERNTVLCNNIEGQDGVRDICILMADSGCCTAEANTTL